MSTFGNSMNNRGMSSYFHDKKTMIVLCVVLALGAGSFGAYKWVVASREQRAQKFFSECVEEYNRVIAQQSGAWEEVEKAFAAGYEKHNSSSIAPYFLAFQADALVHQQKLAEALVLMDKVVQAVPARSPFYPLFATKRSLMKMDSPEQVVKDAGLQELTTLAQDTNNVCRDEAQYYLGAYYWAQNDTEKARTCWQPLLALAKPEDKSASMWAHLAQMKLQQIA